MYVVDFFIKVNEVSKFTCILCISAITPERKKCTKIAPCYIVLTNIDPTMQAKVSISSRAFKRSFVECSNMCKKVMFRRRLKAGKDVFNVKTPSKQKDYLLYIMKEQEKSKKNRKNIVQCTKIQDIIEKHDLKVAARKNSFGTHAHPRVRRTVSKLPKDFAARPLTPLQEEMTQNMENVSTEELEKIQSVFVKKTHKLELNSLKRLIGIKRSLNQNLKKNKRLKPDGFENFLKQDVTSSVSGRVRKVNRKYGPDFAVSRKDFEEQRFFEVAQSQLKRAETENKRKKEEISIDYILQKRRKISTDTETERTITNKKVKTPVITIENPEKDDASKTQFKSKKLNINSRKTNAKANAIRDLLESPPVPGFKENELTLGDKNVKNSRQKRQCKNMNKDAVLIQDLPKEENVISSFLQETENPIEQKPFVIDSNKPSEIKDDEPYGRAKQLLKESLDRKSLRLQKMRQDLTPSQETINSNSHSSNATEQEKFKALKIPETVQKLFKPTDIKIKQEPPDDGYETKPNPPISDNPKVVTIAYGNGMYKKVLMTVPTTSATQPPSNTSIPRPSNTVNAPILVSTKEGLRYLVPSQFLSKLPSYSEAIKAKFSPKMSDTPNVAPMVSLSSGTFANINNTFNASSITQQSTLSSGFQPHLQQQKYVSNIPTMIQLPLNNVTKSTSESVLKPVSPAVTVCQPSVNKAFQQTVKSIKSPICTVPKQTHTVIHKVSPAVQKIIPKTIQQHSVPIMGTNKISGTQCYKKNGEKSKFYLLKIDGKNVLIPTEDQAQPKAYIVNNDFINSNTLSKTQESLVASSAALGTIQPTLPGCSAFSSATQKHSTMVPNVKPVNTPLAQNVTSLSQNKNILQTVLLTNADTVSSGDIVNKTMFNRFNTAMLDRTNAIVGNTANLSGNVTIETNTALSSMNSLSAKKTSAAITNVVKSGSVMVAPNSVTSQPSLIQNNADSMQQNSMTLVPLFLKPSDTSPFCGILQSNVAQAGSKNVLSPVRSPLDTQREAKPRPSLLITNMPNALMQNQVSPLGNSSMVKQGQTTVRSQLDSLRKNTTKTSQGVTQKAGRPSDVILSQNNIPTSVVNTQGQTKSNISTHEGKHEDNKKNGKLCEKTGKFELKETCEENVEQAIESEPRPFKEAVTAREERLRRLKELLKEKQKAVDEIRSSKPK